MNMEMVKQVKKIRELERLVKQLSNRVSSLESVSLAHRPARRRRVVDEVIEDDTIFPEYSN